MRTMPPGFTWKISLSFLRPMYSRLTDSGREISCFAQLRNPKKSMDRFFKVAMSESLSRSKSYSKYFGANAPIDPAPLYTAHRFNVELCSPPIPPRRARRLGMKARGPWRTTPLSTLAFQDHDCRAPFGISSWPSQDPRPGVVVSFAVARASSHVTRGQDGHASSK